MLVDLHVYTAPSGGPSVERAVEQAAALGLDGIAVVDRHASADVARRVVGGEFGDFPVFVGVELATAAGDVLIFVPNLDPFFTREEWRELEVVGLPELSDVVEMVEREGGVVLSAQPYDRKRARSPRDRVFSLDALAGLEVWTSTSDATANTFAQEAGARASVAGFAGTANASSRGSSEPWVTLFSALPTTQAELVEALKGGDFWPVEIGSQRARSGGDRRPRSNDRGDRQERGDRPERSSRGRGGSDRRPRR